eukprot:3601089-Lingulodinium_polyedra.AAC.1
MPGMSGASGSHWRRVARSLAASWETHALRTRVAIAAKMTSPRWSPGLEPAQLSAGHCKPWV